MFPPKRSLGDMVRKGALNGGDTEDDDFLGRGGTEGREDFSTQNDRDEGGFLWRLISGRVREEWRERTG